MVKKRKKAPYKALKITLITIFSLFILSIVASAGAVLAIIKNAPPLDVNQVLTLNEPSVLYNDKDEFMDKMLVTEQRNIISFKDMPEDLKNAFVSIEDERFYKHGGIDFKRIIGSAYVNVKSKIKGKSSLQGASTITQQLLKNTILSSEVSWKRKIQEGYLAVNLEKQLTKEQILEAYMNTISLGGSIYGVETASQQYFAKPAKDLNLIQCAFIAGVTQNPSVYYPYSPSAKKNPSLYLNRTKNVLMKMNENGYISSDQYNQALSDLESGKLVFQPYSAPKNKLNYEWFSRPAIEEVKKDLKAEYHYTDTEIQHLVMYGGLKIYTTMDKSIQDNTQALLDADSTFGLNSRRDKNGIMQPQASAVIIDYHTGDVKAIVGGRGDQNALSYNRAASDNFLRRPGSTIKPLTVYGAAIDSKQMSAATSVDDSPWPDNLVKMYGFSPKNDTLAFGQYGSNVTLRTAIMHSLNVPAVNIENQIGLRTGAEYAEKFGLKLDPSDKSSISALALGQMTYGTNPYTMAAAYGVFGNNGVYTYPKFYRKVVDRTGKTLLENKKETKQVLSAESAYIMYDILKGPVSPGGTGPRANFGNMPVRGKTGTSGESKDLWFTGLTPYYSASVWVGNDDNTIVSGANSNMAAGVWAAIMQPVHANLVAKDITMPQGVVSAAVCLDSGKLPTSACYSDPTGNKVSNELFLEGSIPSDYCNLSHSSGYKNSIWDNQFLKPSKDKNNQTNYDNGTEENPDEDIDNTDTNGGTDKPGENNTKPNSPQNNEDEESVPVNNKGTNPKKSTTKNP